MMFHKQPIPDCLHWSLKMLNMEMDKQIKIYLKAKYSETSNIISTWDHIATWKDRFFTEQITECTMIQQYTQKTLYIGIVYQHAIMAEKWKSCPTLLALQAASLQTELSGKPHWQKNRKQTLYPINLSLFLPYELLELKLNSVKKKKAKTLSSMLFLPLICISLHKPPIISCQFCLSSIRISDSFLSLQDCVHRYLIMLNQLT